MHPSVSEAATPPSALTAVPAAGIHRGTITITPATPPLRALQRRLAKWEIAHLREHAADLAERLEAAEKRAADAEQRLSWAEDSAEFWREQSIEAINQAADEAGGRPGITMGGRLVVVPAPAERLRA